MNHPGTLPLPAAPRRRRRRNHGRTLVEMMVALGVFATATLGIWETIRTVLFLSAKNTGLNLTHTALQSGVDKLAEQLRGSLQIVDVATFDGTTFTHINEGTAAGTSASGNAVRFVRLLPVTVFMLPDSGKTYTMSSPESGRDLGNPDDFLAAGAKTVKGTYTLVGGASLTEPNLAADLTNARLLPRFPYLTESITSGSNIGSIPGLDILGLPTFSGSNVTLTLVNGLPSTAGTVPSCNQAYLIVVSAFAVLNRGTPYAELLYYPDAANVSRRDSLTQALASSTTGSGPLAFALPKTAGPLSDPFARSSLQITLPIYAPYLGNTVIRRGGNAALANIELNLPVETRRRAQL